MEKNVILRKPKPGPAPLRIIGIDPGYAIVGWGIVDYAAGLFRMVACGAVQTEAGLPFGRRLEIIWDEIGAILDKCKPQSMAMEKLFFTQNQKTGIDVAQARGVLYLSAIKRGLDVAEYTPLQVKQAVVGYGKADKKQVMQMTKMLLGLERTPKPDDTADALAVAICHAHSASSAQNRTLLNLR